MKIEKTIEFDYHNWRVTMFHHVCHADYCRSYWSYEIKKGSFVATDKMFTYPRDAMETAKEIIDAIGHWV